MQILLLLLLGCNPVTQDFNNTELKILQIDTAYIQDIDLPAIYSCEELCSLFQQCGFLEDWWGGNYWNCVSWCYHYSWGFHISPQFAKCIEDFNCEWSVVEECL